MGNLIEIHDKNGTDAVTVSPEHLTEQLIAYGFLQPVINLLNALKVMSVARAIDDKGDGYKQAAKDYKEAYNSVVDMVTPKAATAKAELPKMQKTDAKKCKDCGHLVLWLKDVANKSVPVFAENVGINENAFNPDIHKTHYFNDCKRVKGVSKSNKFTLIDAQKREEQAKLF